MNEKDFKKSHDYQRGGSGPIARIFRAGNKKLYALDDTTRSSFKTSSRGGGRNGKHGVKLFVSYNQRVEAKGDDRAALAGSLSNLLKQKK